MMPIEAETPPTTPPADPSARRLKVRRVKLSDLIEDVGNPRRHDERDLAATEASLKAHGQVDPLVVQKGTMRLIAGHGRKEAMRRLGWKQAEIVEVECDDTEFRALSIRLNRTGELAGWNFAVLEAELAMLADAGWGNLPDFGFDEAALDALAGGIEKVENLPNGGGAEPPAAPNNAPRPSLNDRFLVPPFSVLDARQGYWQERKRAWLSIGIQSELGRGGSGAYPTTGSAASVTDSLHAQSVAQNGGGDLIDGRAKGLTWGQSEAMAHPTFNHYREIEKAKGGGQRG